MRYEWSDAKREQNVAKHGIDFIDAVLMFEGPILQWTRLPQSYPELRVMAVGQVDGVEVLVVYTQIDPTTRRIISARRAKRKERRRYAQAFPGPPAP